MHICYLLFVTNICAKFRKIKNYHATLPRWLPILLHRSKTCGGSEEESSAESQAVCGQPKEEVSQEGRLLWLRRWRRGILTSKTSRKEGRALLVITQVYMQAHRATVTHIIYYLTILLLLCFKKKKFSADYGWLSLIVQWNLISQSPH